MTHTVIGIDIANLVFQLHWIDGGTEEPQSLRLKREQFLEHFAKREVCLIGMESCGGSQHWARELRKLGHQVKLLPARVVKPFVGRNKNDAADARAIWTAMQQPGVKPVAVKTEAQQAILAMHRVRARLVGFRTAQINALHGLLAEYGEAMPRGRAGLRREISPALKRLQERLPIALVDTLREQYARLDGLDTQVEQIEHRLREWHAQDEASRRIADIPGVGLLTATAAIATMGDPKAFKSGREFSAWLGLVPLHSGSGNRVRMLGISKRGDNYLRSLLILGARSVMRHGNAVPERIKRLAERRPKNVAIVALANRMARTLWALTAHERQYQTDYVSPACRRIGRAILA